ncbi:MAG: L,D-transpeptidase family protein [Chthoniobacterales bacterium]|nr:L,D-transpeptidase family protein [Chthoniobacterales bacterium]
MENATRSLPQGSPLRGCLRQSIRRLPRRTYVFSFLSSTLACCFAFYFFASVEPLHCAEKSKSKVLSLFRSSDLIQTQDQGKVFPKILANPNHEPISIRVSLSQQKAFLYVGNQLGIESPISSGKRPGWTPVGSFTILAKEPNHASTIYGNFVDSGGRIVREGICSRTDSAPSGTHYEGAPMLHFMPINNKVGFHAGYLPGYPASHGCIRMPASMAKLFYENTPLKTPVVITP